jgi:hypothetical protein
MGRVALDARGGRTERVGERMSRLWLVVSAIILHTRGEFKADSLGAKPSRRARPPGLPVDNSKSRPTVLQFGGE